MKEKIKDNKIKRRRPFRAFNQVVKISSAFYHFPHCVLFFLVFLFCPLLLFCLQWGGSPLFFTLSSSSYPPTALMNIPSVFHTHTHTHPDIIRMLDKQAGGESGLPVHCTGGVLGELHRYRKRSTARGTLTPGVTYSDCRKEKKKKKKTNDKKLLTPCDFHAQVSRVCREWCEKLKTSSEQQFCRQKRVVNERGQRRRARLVEADGKVTAM